MKTLDGKEEIFTYWEGVNNIVARDVSFTITPPPFQFSVDGVADIEDLSESTVEMIAKKLKGKFGIVDKVLSKCKYCGQYGAVMCSCPQCGAPIDPE